MSNDFRKIFNSYHPSVKIIFDIIITLFVFAVVFFVGIFILSSIYSMSFSDLIKNSGIDGNVDIIRLTHIVTSIGTFAAPALIIAFLYDKKVFKYVGMTKSAKIYSYFNVLMLIIISLPIVNSLATFNTNIDFPDALNNFELKMREMEQSATVITQKLLYVDNFFDLLMNLLIIGVITAIGEELLFRGIIQKHLSEWFKNEHIGIFVTAVVFSAFHFQFLSFLPRLFLGIVLGYLFFWSKSLWLPIIAHFINNSFAIIAYYFANKKGLEIDKQIDSFGTDSQTFLFTIFSIIIFAFSMFIIYRTETKNQQKIE